MKARKAADKLRALRVGEVLNDAKSLRKYSRDQSIYQIEPVAVVIPKDLEGLVNTIAFAARAALPLTARGGGSGTAGSALGPGIVVAARADGFLGGIEEQGGGPDHLLLRAGAAVFHRALQERFRAKGFFLAADPTSSAISQIGGNVATKASGPHALKYGSIANFLHAVQFVTSRGELVATDDPASLPANLRQGVETWRRKILADQEAVAILAVKRGQKTASGYNLPAMLAGLATEALVGQLLVGSVGTLGYITAATLRGLPALAGRGVMRLYFTDLTAAVEASRELVARGAVAVELVNRETLETMHKLQGKNGGFGDAHHLVLAEFSGPEAADQLRQARHFLLQGGCGLAGRPEIATEDKEIARLWRLRQQILPVLSRPGSHLRALPVVNDVGVPPAALAPFIRELVALFERHSLPALIYGHAGSGNLHLRPLFDCRQKGLRRQLVALADAVYGLVLHHGGTITAEHGMGRLRAPYLRREWGASIHGYMQELKEIFDPGALFNPGVMFGDRPITDHMRADLLRRGRAKAGGKR